MDKKKVVVAFSGGLDTSFTVMYLAKEKGYDVYAACANTGGFSPEQLKQNEENAYKLGATKYVTLDVTREYYDKSLRYMIYGNVLRNGTYPISVSSERIFQALAIARYANEIGASAIAHGSTGAGNDQIRFDMTFLVLAPGVEIITLTRDMALTREFEINYLNEHGFSADFAKLKYSYNVGLWGTSICGGEILDSKQGLPETAYLKQVTKEGEEDIVLEFKNGELVGVNGTTYEDGVKAIQAVEDIAAPYGIGRDMHVGDTIIGIKSTIASMPSILPSIYLVIFKFILCPYSKISVISLIFFAFVTTTTISPGKIQSLPLGIITSLLRPMQAISMFGFVFKSFNGIFVNFASSLTTNSRASTLSSTKRYKDSTFVLLREF